MKRVLFLFELPREHEPGKRRGHDRLSAGASAKEGEIVGSEGQIHRLTSVATNLESIRTVPLIPNDLRVRFEGSPRVHYLRLVLALALGLWLGPPAAAQVAPGSLLDPQQVAGMLQVRQAPEVGAEFDPPVASLGAPISYLVAVTANPEGVSVPEQPPTPPGLRLKYIGRAYFQTITTNRTQTVFLFSFRASVTSTGTYIMPPFEASANGRRVTVPSTTLEVGPTNAAAQTRLPRLIAELPQPVCYIGQTVPVRAVLLEESTGEYRALGRMHILSDAVIVEPASTRYQQEMRPWHGRYVRATLLESLVTPVREGSTAITILAEAHRNQPRAAGAVNAGVFTLLDADPVSLEVRHPPDEGRLPGFTGAIGQFQMDPPRLSKDQLQVGEPCLLTLTIRGSNGLVRLNPPELAPTTGWQTFPPAADGFPAALVQQRGFALFQYTLVPLAPGRQTTPPIPFSAFDPTRRAYVDLTVPPVPVEVLPAPVAATATARPTPSFTTETGNGLVLPGLLETPGLRANSLTPLPQRGWFLAVQLLPALALAWCAWRERQRRRLAAHPEILLRARARRGMRRAMRQRRQALARRHLQEALLATRRALQEFAAPATGGHAEALVFADVRSALPPQLLQEADHAAVRDLFDLADALRFQSTPPAPERVLPLMPRFNQLLPSLKRHL